MKRVTLILYAMISLLGPSAQTASAQTALATPQRGVELALAEKRAKEISNVEYNLCISIPDSVNATATGHVDISFSIERPHDVVLDFFKSGNIVSVNREYSAVNEHIVLPAASLRAGINTVGIDFCIDQSLINRRDHLLYTLSVPDKARRLFPCFDQPDMKATYRLTLSLPAGWKAVSNGAITDSSESEGRSTVTFAPTEPLSTYLFAFAAGRFERRSMTKGGRTISLYHCETDTARTAQCDEILNEVFASLEWLENYTSTPYPFAKYDLVIIPGFQFGGMEHTGATLYNDRVLFLPPQATLNERLARTSLIAHETSHMWFGDYVTMKWFGEVWTKEVFANYYAAVISEPLYPDVDHRLGFMLSYAPLSYAEDRTEGANPIQQQLANLQDAGLVYGNIIYDKSPMMMRQLVSKIGEKTFREGIRRYLRQHAYGNATWDELISTLDSLTSEDLKSWSSCWVDGAGMPVYRLRRNGRTLTITQEGTLCPQKVTILADGREITANCSGKETELRLPSHVRSIIPNSDGMAYGYFAIDGELLDMSIEAIGADDALLRGATLINLNEALWRGDIGHKLYMERLTAHLSEEKNPLLFNLCMNQLRSAHTRYADSADKELENVLSNILFHDTSVSRKVTALRALADVMDSPAVVDTIYNLWLGKINIEGLKLSDVDAMAISYQLAVRMPEMADSIVAMQRSRLQSNNLREEYDFIAPSVSPRQEERDALFERLLTVEGRSVEPWAERALANLNHRYRRNEQMRYVWRGLEAVEEVKRTGDIFFPKRWVAMLVSGQRHEEVVPLIKQYLADHPDYPEMLKRKILMNAYQHK
jgi:aminopeptidase N